MKKEFTCEEFHTNPKVVIEAANEGTVTILGDDGEPRMFICKQLQPLECDCEIEKENRDEK